MKLEICYCKHCDTTFQIKIAEFVTRAFLIECPQCRWQHPRQFEAGVAVHCDINLMDRPEILKAIPYDRS